MRAVLVLIVIVVILALLGWITFQNGGNQATVTIDKEKINEDTHGMIEKGGEAVEEAGKSLKKAMQTDQRDSELKDSAAKPVSPVEGERVPAPVQ